LAFDSWPSAGIVKEDIQEDEDTEKTKMPRKTAVFSDRVERFISSRAFMLKLIANG
jgi:hypothetical protein